MEKSQNAFQQEKKFKMVDESGEMLINLFKSYILFSKKKELVKNNVI